MNKPAPIDSELLAIYLAGEADDAQQRTVEDWATAAAENHRELERMRTVWELGGVADPLSEVDVDAAWARLEGRIAEAEGRGIVRPIGAWQVWVRWSAAAAVVAGLVFAATWLFRSQDSFDAYATTTETLDAVLSDSSRSVIMPGSRLEVRMGDTREVRLTGQAYFEVLRDEQRPFVVDAGDVWVTVLGTAFEVSAYDTAQLVTVRVRSGRVRVTTEGDTVELVAGERVVYNRKRHLLERGASLPAEVWGGRVLHFEGATMDQVAEQLERIYRVRVELRNEAIARCRITAEFEEEPIEEILNVIAETFGLELQRSEDGTFSLDGDGC